jgi:hypothetical protein
MCCSVYFIFQHWSHITYIRSKICSSGYFILHHFSLISYTMSTCSAAINSFFSTGLVLSTLGQRLLQRLFYFSALVSYYLHYINKCCSGYSILEHCSLITYIMSTCPAVIISFFSIGLVLPTLSQRVLKRLVYFSALLSNSLHYVNICYSGYFIFQHCSRITYTMWIFYAAVT